MKKIKISEELSSYTNYSFVNTLKNESDTKFHEENKTPRDVFSGHYVLVETTHIKEPIYISHSKTFFEEQKLLKDEYFKNIFSADVSKIKRP